MIGQVLNKEQEEILGSVRGVLTDLLASLAKLQPEASDEATLKGALNQLDQIFLLVVTGEFNSGKSALINSLVGKRILEEGVTPTTRGIHILCYGEPSGSFGGDVQRTIQAEVDLLRHLSIVDTPGTNAIRREHQAITEEFIPRSDLILFVTSAERPFTESERAFLEKIQAWGKKIIFVINKIDLLDDPESLAKVEKFVFENVSRLLGFDPEIFSVSARKARLARESGEGGNHGQFYELEHYIRETLDEAERIRLKFLSPLGVGSNLCGKYLEALAGGLRLLQDDLESLQAIEAQQRAYEEDMRREFRFRLSDIQNILHEFERRGVEFFDERLRLSRIVELLNKAQLKLEFEKKVIGSVPQDVERRVQELIDWMVSAEFNHWQNVMNYLNRHATGPGREMVGEIGTRFQYDRDRLLNSVGEKAERVIGSYDREREAKQMAERVQFAIAETAIVEAGAIGLGTAVAFLAGSTLADITGIIAAGTLAVLGLFVLPARRSHAKRDLHARIAEMKKQLLEALEFQFDRELRKSLSRIEEAISPYSRFVRTEKKRFTEAMSLLQEIQGRLQALKSRLE